MARITQSDILMRQDGYVTAAEVAEALQKDLATIHRSIDEGRIPGKSIGQAGGKYKHRYVDIHALVNSGAYADAPTMQGNLSQLAMLVAKPAAASAERAPPKPKALKLKKKVRAGAR